ncbi:tyrosine-type recombinase/integrase [Alkalihalobacterium alkalinitrilicum]|uniref:tyrosine-type recombinase/integrase n=1 Tax=Alkalihalobacterium alkalinitrilicum TaxID=427920 RepID=UPI001EE434BB|nr:tyrosine-type recombinase/integrase [Alkalihalobacterium alkalinitrilicum]
MILVYRLQGCTCSVPNCKCDKSWAFVIDIGRDPETGKRKQATKGGFGSIEEAQFAAQTLLNEKKHGTYIKESNILFKDFAQEWLSIYQERTGAKSGTMRLRKYSINKLLPYLAHVKLRDITEEMYQKAINDLKAKNFARSTLEGFHTTGKMIFKMALSKRMIKINPTEYAYIPRDPEVVIESDEEDIPKYLELDELLQFLDTAKNKGLFMDELIFTTLAFTGMRVGELVVLKWKDIDFDNHTIKITKTYNNEKNNTIEYSLGTPKTKRSRRTISVHETVIELFKKHKAEQEKLKERFGPAYYDQDFVFANINRHPGYPILTKFVGTRINRLSKFFKFKVCNHTLRHTHTSLLAEAGVKLDPIKDRLGHFDDETTRKVYLHVTSTVKREASDKFGQLIQGRM